MKNYHFILLIFIPHFIFASENTISTKGQLWSSMITSNDVPKGQSNIESNFGYIPFISIAKELSNNQLLDLEFAYRLDRIYSGDSLFYNNESNHRYWVRYSNEKLETRLGLQKIVFGPSFILRSLSWFDTIDLRDPTGQTKGVEAFRLRWFPSNKLSLWSWAIKNEQDTLSYGGRAELSSLSGEWGVTYHKDPSKQIKLVGQVATPVIGSDERLAIDFRYDGIIGFWNESILIRSNRSKTTMITIGADYTFPFATGILITGEYMNIKKSDKNSWSNDPSDRSYSALMASLPLGMAHQLMVISQMDLETERNFHYLRWSSTYDHYSVNFILSINPKRSTYNTYGESIPRLLAGFGTGFQLMFIYNH